jgi:hypothetical protein
LAQKNLSKKIAEKRGGNQLIFVEIIENQTINYENLFIVPIIGLLLQIHNTTCILHAYSSTVEILENSI